MLIKRKLYTVPNKIESLTVEYFIFHHPLFFGGDCKEFAGFFDCGEVVHERREQERTGEGLRRPEKTGEAM
jgi:hypothetical protein